MKTTKTQKSTASNSHSSKPFFSKSGEGSFFSQSKESEKPFFAYPIQPKLTVGQPNDIYEQEADSMAEKVVQKLENPNPSLPAQRKCEKCDQEEKPQKKEEDNEEMEVVRNPIFESDDYPKIQAKSIESNLNISRGKGKPLAKDVRSNMESAFGTDFSSVQIHTDSTAIQMNQQLNAKAFTYGSDVYFNQAGYNPQTNEGKRLLAHELTHVVQQKGVKKSKNLIQRDGLSLPALGDSHPYYPISCLSDLFDRMRSQSIRYLRQASADGNYITSLSGLHFLTEGQFDAFGHCWIGCQGTQTCGQVVTRIYGNDYEYYREVQRILSFGIIRHNSFEEDWHNQSVGRSLAAAHTDEDCFDLSYNALNNNLLRFHSGTSSDDSANPVVYVCSPIRLDGRRYPQGWRRVPIQHTEVY